MQTIAQYIRRIVLYVLQAVALLVLIAIFGPLNGILKLTRWIATRIFGYDGLDRKNKALYHRGRYAHFFYSLVFLCIFGVILFSAFFFLQFVFKTTFNVNLTLDLRILWHLIVFITALIGATGFIVLLSNIVLFSQFAGFPDWKTILQVLKVRQYNAPLFFITPISVGGIIALAWLMPEINFVNYHIGYADIIFKFTITVLLSFPLVYFFLPPFVLLLSTSSENNLVLQAMLDRTDYKPIASLLNEQGDYVKNITGFNSFFVYRTYDETRWTESVRILMNLCPIIVMDTRLITDPLLTEAYMVFINKLHYKTLFIVQEDYSHPLLDTFFNQHSTLPVKTLTSDVKDLLFTESELIDLFNDQPRLKALVKTKTALKR